MFKNQVVIITGAGRGIGAEAAKLFAEQGASVVVNDLNPEPANETVAAIEAAGGKAIAYAGNVTEEDFAEGIFKHTIDTFGKVNILVNNAGYTWDAMTHKMTDEQWQAILDVHATAPFRLIRAATPYMRDAAIQEHKEGKTPEARCIINVSSTSGLHGNIGQANYAFAKMGVVGLTKTIAKEWGPFGIRCNTVAFGYIDTRLTRTKEDGETVSVNGKEVELGIPEKVLEGMQGAEKMIPLGRAGTATEAAGGIIMLASPFASYVSGHTLEVTGGVGI